MYTLYDEGRRAIDRHCLQNEQELFSKTVRHYEYVYIDLLLHYEYVYIDLFIHYQCVYMSLFLHYERVYMSFLYTPQGFYDKIWLFTWFFFIPEKKLLVHNYFCVLKT